MTRKNYVRVDVTRELHQRPSVAGVVQLIPVVSARSIGNSSAQA